MGTQRTASERGRMHSSGEKREGGLKTRGEWVRQGCGAATDQEFFVREQLRWPCRAGRGQVRRLDRWQEAGKKMWCIAQKNCFLCWLILKFIYHWVYSLQYSLTKDVCEWEGNRNPFARLVPRGLALGRELYGLVADNVSLQAWGTWLLLSAFRRFSVLHPPKNSRLFFVVIVFFYLFIFYFYQFAYIFGLR